MPEVPPLFQRRDPDEKPPEPAQPTRGPFDGAPEGHSFGAFEPAPQRGEPPAAPLAPPPAPFGADARPASPVASVSGLTMTTTGVPHYPPPGAVPQPPLVRAPGAVAAPPSRGAALRLLGRGLRELAETLVLALLIFLLVRSVVQNFQVDGRSMEPTLDNGWYLLVNKSLYWEINMEAIDKFIPFVDPGSDPDRYIFRAPKRGDIIVFRAPEQTPGSPERDFIKRIIGLPGETVEVHDCTVYIDGQALEEPYIQERPTYTYPPEVVPPGHYFVLGDNRNNSSDSHSWGMLPKGNIIGQAWLSYWPWSHFGLIDDTSVKPNGTAPAKGPDKNPVACP